MKTFASTLFALLVVFSSGCACTKIKRVDGPAFIKAFEQVEHANSYSWTSYIGKTHQRAYLEYGTPAFIGNGNRVTVLWAPLLELPEDFILPSTEEHTSTEAEQYFNPNFTL